MMEYVDTAMLVFILSTVIYLVKKTTVLCHDVENLKKGQFILRIDKLDAQILDAINSMYASGKSWKYIADFLHNEVEEAIGMYRYEVER